MDEFIKTFDVRRSVKDFGPFRDCCEGTEEKWITSICPCFGKSNSISRRRYSAVHRGSSFWRVKPFTQEDDGEESVVVALSVRGPPSLGLRARTKDVAQVLMALRGGVPTHIVSNAIGRLIGDQNDRFKGFCWGKTLWHYRKGRI